MPGWLLKHLVSSTLWKSKRGKKTWKDRAEEKPEKEEKQADGTDLLRLGELLFLFGNNSELPRLCCTTRRRFSDLGVVLIA